MRIRKIEQRHGLANIRNWKLEARSWFKSQDCYKLEFSVWSLPVPLLFIKLGTIVITLKDCCGRKMNVVQSIQTSSENIMRLRKLYSRVR